MNKSKKLPDGVYYTARNGGMYVAWNGRPEGQVHYTFNKDVAYETAEPGEEWSLTPYQGADGGCRLNRIIELAAEYGA